MAAADPTVYPVEDDVGEGSLQRFISELLRALIERWLDSRSKSRRKPVFVGADQFFYWEQYNPIEGIAPDVYVLPGVDRSTRVGAWKVWETGLVPSFAFEIVSRDIDKDYINSPAKYARLGVEELVVFDPDYQESRSRVRWQIFRRTKRGLLRVESTDADRIRSRVLGCHLRVVGEGGEMRVRVAYGANGETLLPTDAEALEQAEAERQRAEDERQRAEDERQRAEAERQRAEGERQRLAEALEAERRAREALEAELARLQGLQPESPRRPRPRKAKR
ncbi:Uma2 family endonuclease [Sorangium cellulosum]|uniref:Uma2 family endonuclease n=1 Tax=Sorangium cellulosum TaxID=56 RepID=UPI001F5DBE10|nr:Uma2 family endonuclease [Sorangium cellulosum]